MSTIRFFYISHLKAVVVRQEPFIYDAFVSYSEEQGTEPKEPQLLDNQIFYCVKMYENYLAPYYLFGVSKKGPILGSYPEAWVHNKLVPFLEKTEPALKLCLHHRDFQV